MSDIPPCEKDFETLFGEWLKATTEWLSRMEQKQDDTLTILNQNLFHFLQIQERVSILVETLERFRPMIERYEQAAKANGFRAQRAALKGKNNG